MVAFAWLPAGDYEQAVTLWPDLASSERVAGPDGKCCAATSFIDTESSR
jgi:hypothetical protein